jgi:hypothetical protein
VGRTVILILSIASISAHDHFETVSCGAAPTVSPTHRAAESQLAFRLSSEGGIRKARVNATCWLSNERRSN